MDATNRPSQISLDRLHALTLRYNTQITDKIQRLEELRVITIPETLKQRKKDGTPLLEKTEVTSLVEWKLYVTSINMNPSKLQQLTSQRHPENTARTVLISLSSLRRTASKMFVRPQAMHSRYMRQIKKPTISLSRP